MKIKSLFILVVLSIGLSLLVSPVSAVWPVNGIYDFVVGIYGWLQGLPNIIYTTVAAVLALAFYPPILILNVIWWDVSLIWNTVITFLNNILSMPKNVLIMFQTFAPVNFPTVWTMLFVFMITVNSYFVSERILKKIHDWLPALLGGS